MPTHQDPHWHALAGEAVLAALTTSAERGLSPADVAERRRLHGRNELPTAPPRPWWAVLAAQFKSLVTALLAVATGVALWAGQVLDAAAIAAVLVVNGAFGFVTEMRARRAIRSLSSLEAPDAVVVRDGSRQTLDAAELVPGDIVAVEEGDAIPADLRLLESRGLTVEEAALTGESVPTLKRHDAELDPSAPISERVTMIHQGTAVVSGSGLGVVVRTGESTELGRIGRLLREVQDEATPLEVRLDQLGRRLIVLTVAVTAVVVLIGVLRGEDWALMIETGLALAVAAVPEGLPAVATVSLAVGLRRMARRNALVRRLPSVETLGAVTVICTDKTGTLTTGKMRVDRAEGMGFAVDVVWEGGNAQVKPAVRGGSKLGEGPEGDAASGREEKAALDLLIEIGAVVNRSRTEGSGPERDITGDPTDVALWRWAEGMGTDPEELRERFSVIDERPFTSERMWAATYGQVAGRERRWYVKGAPERLLERSDRVRVRGAAVPLDTDARSELLGRNQRLAEEGLRVLGFAVGKGDSGAGPGPLEFVGLVGLLDAPAPEVEPTARLFRDAGIRTLVVTGDQLPTAVAVARRAGLPAEGPRAAVDGSRLNERTDEELESMLADAVVLARVAPEDKLRVVEALQRSHQVVAMLGDGVNDAAALKRADVGVAMGERGADVAKEAADMILLDDRFATVGAAIEQGRVIFENIRKFIYYLFSCNLAEILVILAAGILGWATPLLPLQILWLNLVTDTVPALSLALEPAEAGIMKRRPRAPGSPVLEAEEVASLVVFAALIATVTLVAFWVGVPSGTAHASTLAFFTLAFAQILHLGNARGVGAVLAPARMLASPWALAAVVVAGSLQMLALWYDGLANALRLTTPVGSDWLLIVGLASIPAVLGQIWKSVRPSSDRL